MSLGGGLNQAVNDAVKALTDNGIHTVVSSGNDADDACNASPASEPSAITVGATEKNSDDVTNFSNIGKCVDIFAPGRDIESAGIESNDDTQIFSGTSQSAPHVTGTVALIIAEFGNSPTAEMAKTVNDFATKGVIPEETLQGSPNVFVRVPFKDDRYCYKHHKHHKHHDHYNHHNHHNHHDHHDHHKS
jgi:subtilisin family serine protease